MKEETHIELLKQIGKVKAPPFLLTRIQAKIRGRELERLPVSWQWSSGPLFGLLLLVNFFVAQTQNRTAAAPAETLVRALQLQQPNQFYDE